MAGDPSQFLGKGIPLPPGLAWVQMRVVSRSFITIRGSGEGRENRPQLRCGIASIQISIPHSREQSQSVTPVAGEGEGRGRVRVSRNPQIPNGQIPKDTGGFRCLYLGFETWDLGFCARRAHQMRSPNIRPRMLTRPAIFAGRKTSSQK